MLGSNRGVSPVVSVVLLVGITVALVVGVGFLVFDIGTGTQSEQGIASVTLSSASGSNVSLKVAKLGRADSLVIRTSAGEQRVESLGRYKVESYGRLVSVLAVTDGTRSVVTSYEPQVPESEVSDVVIVRSEQAVNKETGRTTPELVSLAPQIIGSTVASGKEVETLAGALSVSNGGDVIRIESGIHTDSGTINTKVNKSVALTFEDNAVLKCQSSTPVNLRLGNASLSDQSSLPETQSCNSYTYSTANVTYPTPTAQSAVQIEAGGTSSSLSTGSSDTKNTSDTNVTIQVVNTNGFDEIEVETVNGTRNFSEPGEYTVETGGYRVGIETVTSNGGGSDSGGSDSGGSDSGGSDSGGSDSGGSYGTSDTSIGTVTPTDASGDPISEPNYGVYEVQPEQTTIASGSTVKEVSTINEALSQASAGDLIRIASGTHTDPGTVNTTISKAVGVAFADDATLSCEQERVDLGLGKATLTKTTTLPNVVCDSYSNTNETTVVQTIESTSGAGTVTVLSDNFSDGTFTSKWNHRGGGCISENSGVVEINNGNCNGQGYLTSKKSIQYTNYTVTMRIKAQVDQYSEPNIITNWNGVRNQYDNIRVSNSKYIRGTFWGANRIHIKSPNHNQVDSYGNEYSTFRIVKFNVTQKGNQVNAKLYISGNLVEQYSKQISEGFGSERYIAITNRDIRGYHRTDWIKVEADSSSEIK